MPSNPRAARTFCCRSPTFIDIMGTMERKNSKLLAPWAAAVWGLGLGCIVGFFGAGVFQTEVCASFCSSPPQTLISS